MCEAISIVWAEDNSSIKTFLFLKHPSTRLSSSKTSTTVQFAPLEFDGSVSPLLSFLDFLNEFGRHNSNVGFRIEKGFDSEVSFDDDGEVKLSCCTFLNEIA